MKNPFNISGSYTLLALLSGILLLLASPPLNLSWVAWIGLIPIFWVYITSDRKALLFYSGVFSVIWMGIGNAWYFWGFDWWVALLQWIGFIALVPLLFLLMNLVRTHRNVRMALLATPFIWTTFYFLLDILPITRFWWGLNLENTQWNNTIVLQILAFTGVHGITFILVLVNTALTMVFLEWKRARWQAVLWLTVALITVTLVYCGGIIRLQGAQAVRASEKRVVVAALQDNYDHAYFSGDTTITIKTLDIFESQLRLALQQRSDIQYIVGSESMSVFYSDVNSIHRLSALANELNVYLVFSVVDGTIKSNYNSAILFGPDGSEQLLYHKPYPTDADKADGAIVPEDPKFISIETDDAKVGLAICYDQNFDAITKLKNNQSELILVPVDDSRFGPWIFPQLHAAETVFRAVENRTAIATAGITGVSQIVSPYGEIEASSTDTFKKEIIIGDTFVDTRSTFYARYGNVFGYSVLVVLLIIILYPIIRKL